MKLMEWSRFSTIALDLRICVKVSGITRFQAMCRVLSAKKYRKDKRKRECSSGDCSDSNYHSDVSIKRAATSSSSSSAGAGAVKAKDREISHLQRKITRLPQKVEALSEENLMLTTENVMHGNQQSALIRAAGEERNQMGGGGGAAAAANGVPTAGDKLELSPGHHTVADGAELNLAGEYLAALGSRSACP